MWTFILQWAEKMTSLEGILYTERRHLAQRVLSSLIVQELCVAATAAAPAADHVG